MYRALVRLRLVLPFIGDTNAPAPIVAPRDPLVRALEFVAAWFTRQAALRRERLFNASLVSLDAATLRDLGIDRSELGSVYAEWSAQSEPTRRRIAPCDGSVFARR